MWETVLGEYRQWLQASGKPPSTVYLRCWQIRRFAEDHPSGYRVSTAQLATWLGSRGWSPATLASNRATFRGFFGWLVAAGHARTNPALALPPVKVNRRAPRPAPEWVLAEARGDDRTALMLALAGRQGLRRAEVAAIHTRDIVAEDGGWSLVVHGKGNKDRTVPLLPEVAAALRARGPGWIFPNGNGGHLSPNRVGVLIAEALPEGWTAHSLRRRFATRVYVATHDLQAVQELLGHASIATTQVYIGSDAGRLRDAVRHAA